MPTSLPATLYCLPSLLLPIVASHRHLDSVQLSVPQVGLRHLRGFMHCELVKIKRLFIVLWTERVVCAALGRCRQNEVASINDVFGPSVLRAPAEQTKVAPLNRDITPLISTVIQNHRRGCRIVSNFCMGP